MDKDTKVKKVDARYLAIGEIVHVLNRGVDQRDIFLDEKDYLRGVHDLFEFNDVKPALNFGYRLSQSQGDKLQNQSIDLRGRYMGEKRKPRQLIVEILAFCFMPNHFHLLLKQIKEGGIIQFMQKFGGGFAKYFNLKYQRTGALFQGRYKIIPVKREEHFLHLPYYIHFNALDLIMPEWRKGEIRNYREAIKFLETYRWSSYLDYLGKKNFPSVTQREFLLKIFGGFKDYEAGVKKWLKEMSLEEIKEITLE